ncbi:MAG TPA: helix-turn-helix domain-containing protein [Chloroflexota bacterium]|nr:helix-turn-helix domain-containing protein [Chloroflexota bacterium]
MTIPVVAREFGLAESVLYRWAVAGELAGATRMLGRWYVRRVPFERWLEGLDDQGTRAS